MNTNNRLKSFPKRKLVLLLLLIPATVLFAISKKNNTNNHRNILYQEDFETVDLFSSITKQASTSYAIQAVDSPVYTGKKAGRFELRSSDPENKNGTRAELSFPGPGKSGVLERWYSFALYFPAQDFDVDNRDEVISQWHQGGRATPSLCIRTINDRIRLRIKSGTSREEKEWIDLGAIDRDKWHYYVMHVKHSSGDDGRVELWRDNIQLVNHTGPNMYDLRSNYFRAPNWKLGIYKSLWNGELTTQTRKRVLYFDDIKMGSEKASYEDMRGRD